MKLNWSRLTPSFLVHYNSISTNILIRKKTWNTREFHIPHTPKTSTCNPQNRWTCERRVRWKWASKSIFSETPLPGSRRGSHKRNANNGTRCCSGRGEKWVSPTNGPGPQSWSPTGWASFFSNFSGHISKRYRLWPGNGMSNERGFETIVQGLLNSGFKIQKWVQRYIICTIRCNSCIMFKGFPSGGGVPGGRGGLKPFCFWLFYNPPAKAWGDSLLRIIPAH